MKLVKESIGDILKPKNIIGKCFGIKSSATGMIEYIVQIEDVFSSNSISVIYSIRVVYNNFMIEGGRFNHELELDDGKLFSMIHTEFKEMLEDYDFKELSKLDIKEVESKIYELTEFKNFLEKLYNESKAS
jgi:hypothetical protein